MDYLPAVAHSCHIPAASGYLRDKQPCALKCHPSALMRWAFGRGCIRHHRCLLSHWRCRIKLHLLTDDVIWGDLMQMTLLWTEEIKVFFWILLGVGAKWSTVAAFFLVCGPKFYSRFTRKEQLWYRSYQKLKRHTGGKYAVPKWQPDPSVDRLSGLRFEGKCPFL